MNSDVINWLSLLFAVAAIILTYLMWDYTPPNNESLTPSISKIANADETISAVAQDQDLTLVNSVVTQTGYKVSTVRLNDIITWSADETATDRVNTVWPITPPALNGYRFLVSGIDGSTVTTEWNANSFDTLTYRGTTLPTSMYSPVNYSVNTFDVNNAEIEVKFAQWENVTLAAGELVKFTFSVEWSNSQNDAGNVRYAAINLYRDAGLLRSWFQHITNSTGGAEEFITESVYYFDNPGPGTYDYYFTVNAASDNIIAFEKGTTVLDVLYAPNATIVTDDWN